MLNYIWIFMILSGILLGALNGNMSLVTSGLVDSSKEAINLCIVMVGVVGMWSGLMQVAKAAGLIDRLTKTMNPVISFLYPRLPKGHPARDYIATNMIANILGLGWAATPSAVKAMEELAKRNDHRKTASNEMCMLMIINVSSIQLIPVNMIAYRSQYGAVVPSDIIMPAIIATTLSTIVGILFAKLCEKNKRNTF